MADTKLSALGLKTALDGAADWLVAVDSSDVSMAPSGTTARISRADAFGASTPVDHDLIFAATKGLQFDGGGDVFHQYVEGLHASTPQWTPTLYGSTTAGSNTYGANRNGQYILSGRKCEFWGRLTVTAVDAAMAGDIRISGLPYTSFNSGVSMYAAWAGFLSSATTINNQLTAFVANGASFISLYDLTGALTDAALGSTFDIIVGGSYPIA